MIKSEKKRIFMFFLLSYVLILIIPLMMTTYTYQRTTHMMENEVKIKKTTLLELCKNVIDTRFKEIDTLIDRLALSKEVQNMMVTKSYINQKDVIFGIYQFQEYISNYNINNDFIKAFYLFFNYSDIVISPFDTYLSSDRFYNNFFKYDDMTYDEWKQAILSSKPVRTYLPSAPVFINNGFQRTTKNRIACIQPLYSQGTDVKGSVLMLFVDEEDILSLLNEVDTQVEGHSYIFDDRGRLMTTTDKGNQLDINLIKRASTKGFSTFNADDQDMYVYSVISRYNGWKYVSVIPKSTIMQKVDYLKNVYLYATIIYVVLGLMAAYFMAYRNSKPIGEAIANLRRVFDGDNKNKVKVNLDYMRSSVNVLIENNKKLRIRMEEHIPQLRSSFINSVINGEQIDKNITHILVDQLKFDFRSSGFIALIVKTISKVQTTQPDYVVRIYSDKLNVKRRLEEAFGEDMIYDIDADRVLVIYNCEDDEKEIKLLKQRVNDIAQRLNEQNGIRIIVGIGEFTGDFRYFHETYSKAKYALEYKLYDNENYAIWYRDIPKDTNSYYYPIETESHLINYAKVGEFEQIDSLLDTIYQGNIVERKLSPEIMKFLIADMCCTVLRMIQIMQLDKEEERAINEKIKMCESVFSVREQFGVIKEIYRDISDLAISRRKSNNSRLKEDILIYINQNFTDPNIGLAAVSTEFGLSEVYLSQFFKEQTGQNFSAYIEKLRMDTATNLLTTSNLNIKDISIKAGYNSASVFRGAFKRFTGMSPTQYRSNIIE